MSDKSYRIVWVCQECEAEYSSCIADDYSWHSWSDTTCPNGHRGNVIAKIETPEHAWDAVQAWFAYHERFNEPVGLIGLDSLALGVGRGMASIALSGKAKKSQDELPEQLQVIRHLIKEGIATLSPEGDLMLAEMSSSQVEGSHWLVGKPAGFQRMIDLNLKRLPDRLDEAKRRPWDLELYAKPLTTEMELLARIAEQLNYKSDELRTMLDESVKILQESETRQTAIKKASVRRTKKRRAENLLDASLVIVLYLAIAALAIWALTIANTLVSNSDVLLAWLSGIESTKESVLGAWDARPDEIATAIKGSAIIICILLVIAAFVLLQVPLAYFLVGAGCLLSFVVYEKFWLLIVGLVTIGIGAFVFWYWAEQQAAANQYFADQDEE